MEWINVKDKMPPQDGTPFLCYDPNQKDNFIRAEMYVVCYEEESGFSEAGYFEAGGECYFEWKPTHWMPLPEAPKDI